MNAVPILHIFPGLKKDLLKAFPDSAIDTEDSLWDMLDEIFEDYAGRQFMIDAK